MALGGDGGRRNTTALIVRVILGTTTVSLNIGRLAKIFELDIDSGSDLTWVQCDALCTGCTKVKFSIDSETNILRATPPICP
ncbi:hypothetical protein L3X38_037208 [Prunus dulcis]|uniref:Peptidase A1 domain-containing protein n=1 Tax=Prunus dulcis TaxID=3755 RepID=A0AAD4V476_PRUDU|nr:hypothetical protein L3X38_037208 [Prunus dulcis]